MVAGHSPSRRHKHNPRRPTQSGNLQGRPPTLGIMTTDHAMPRGRIMLNKVPEVTVYFWIIKILCTTVGESFADYINETLGFGLTNTTVLFSRRAWSSLWSPSSG